MEGTPASLIERATGRLADTATLPPVTWAPPEERRAEGKARRQRAPRSSHAAWEPAPDRDPIAVLEASNDGREPHLVPIRHGRMLDSPFAFFRGAPALMAADLATTPTSGLVAQLSGDCHIANFGLYASPGRVLVFDLNDFDETLPGPWEWDVKRLAASAALAARQLGLSDKKARKTARAAARAYRRRMARYATADHLDVWYRRVKAKQVWFDLLDDERQDTAEKLIRKARRKDRLKAFDKLTELAGDERRFVDDPPLLRRLNATDTAVTYWLTELFHAYRATLPEAERRLLAHYRVVDVAQKIVGVGSIGLRCYVLLLLGNTADDPLFLQVKEARPSILEPYLGRSAHDHPGRRVVTGQRLMQATSDIFLGYTQSLGDSYYVRQLYDMKGKIDPETMSPGYLKRYAKLCGRVLARAHARTGDAAQIAGYLGRGKNFDKAVGRFALRYAEQTERDFAAFREAVASGRLPVEPE